MFDSLAISGNMQFVGFFLISTWIVQYSLFSVNSKSFLTFSIFLEYEITRDMFKHYYMYMKPTSIFNSDDIYKVYHQTHFIGTTIKRFKWVRNKGRFNIINITKKTLEHYSLALALKFVMQVVTRTVRVTSILYRISNTTFLDFSIIILEAMMNEGDCGGNG